MIISTKYNANILYVSVKLLLIAMSRVAMDIYMRIYCKLAQHVQFSNYNIWLKLVGDGAVLF